MQNGDRLCLSFECLTVYKQLSSPSQTKECEENTKYRHIPPLPDLPLHIPCSSFFNRKPLFGHHCWCQKITRLKMTSTVICNYPPHGSCCGYQPRHPTDVRLTATPTRRHCSDGLCKHNENVPGIVSRIELHPFVLGPTFSLHDAVTGGGGTQVSF